MSCQHCDKLGINHDEVVRRCLEDPYYAGKVLCRFDLMTPELHGVWSRWFLRGIEEGHREFLVMTPRMHFKSTLFGISVMMWLYINSWENRILYMMAASEKVEENLGALKKIIADPDPSKPFAHFFPDKVAVPNECRTWAAAAIELPRRGTYSDPTIKAVGLRSRITGGHHTHLIFDDLIDQTMARSEIEQQGAIRLVKGIDALGADVTKDIRLIIGTNWEGPFYEWLLNSGAMDDYQRVVLGCYIDDRYREFMESMGEEVHGEDGDPIFPQKFPAKALAKIRKKDEYEFSRQWLNTPVDEGTRRFRQEDFLLYNFESDDEGNAIGIINPLNSMRVKFSEMYRTLTIDPATGEGSGTDQSAITVCGFDRKTGNIYVLEAWDGRVLPFDLIDKALNLAEKWKVHVLAPEDASFQKTFKHFIAQEMRSRRKYFSIRPVKPGSKSKGARIIDSLQPFVRNQQVHVSRAMTRLVNEAVNLQVVGGKVIGRSPNLIDSLAYHAVFWRGVEDMTEDDDDIEFADAFVGKPKPRYGLGLRT